MKITIGAYEVKISATNIYNGDIATKEFLNIMGIAFAEQAAMYKTNGCTALKEEADKMHNDIYKHLDNKGYYTKDGNKTTITTLKNVYKKLS